VTEFMCVFISSTEGEETVASHTDI